VAARGCGLRTAFIPRPMEHGPDQTSDLRPEQNWDAVASDLVELAGRLGL
jgi:2-haloacid dehalogenase